MFNPLVTYDFHDKERYLNMASGARFHRGDLHIHSYGHDGSYDVNDEEMTPKNIIQKAIEKNLSIISITDHNRIANSIEAVRCSADLDILVIPGVEISTSQGHLLAYFPTIQDLEDCYGKLTFDSNKKFCSQTIYDCMEHVKKYGGFGILAHIEVDSGFEKSIVKFNEIFDIAFQHPAILALEITSKESINLYTELDDDLNRRNAMIRRNNKLALPSNYKLAKIMSSDSHSMNFFGKNLSGSERLTRFKMDQLTFESLRIALYSHDSRVRLEDDIPEALPRFKEFKATGGILDGMQLELSNNMNCIIGGRGTGKSTLLTAIQEASNNQVLETKIQKSSAWPSKIELKYEDEAGREFDCILEHGHYQCFNSSGEIVDIAIAIEAYHQGFTTFANNSDEDTKDSKLLNFFDGFTSVDYLVRDDHSVIVQLESNFDELERLTIEVDQSANIDKELGELVSKQAAYEEQNVGELMQLHSGLIAEEALRVEIETALSNLSDRYKKVLSDDSEIKEILQTDQSKVKAGSENLTNVINIVQDFSDIVVHHQELLNKALEEKLKLLRTEVKDWRAKERGEKAKIEVIKRHLDEQKIPYNEGNFVQLSTDITRLKARQKIIQRSRLRLNEVQKERRALFQKRKKIHADIHNKRLKFCTRINQDLSDSVDGLFVDSKIGNGFMSKDFSSFLKKEMEWHRWTNSDKISNAVSPIQFYENMKFKRYQFLSDLGFSQDDVDAIVGCISGLKLDKVLSLPFQERPKLTVTKHNKATSSADIKDISELSLGQQQSIMLSILILSDSTLPLLIDQPEDNLDSEFIFNSVVSNLRRCKEKRQIILVTHNSNIGVLGDAELVIPLVASSHQSTVTGAGSIDNSQTQSLCCEILEGGRRAFTTRKEIYGI